jgi:hypothetical protein
MPHRSVPGGDWIEAFPLLVFVEKSASTRTAVVVWRSENRHDPGRFPPILPTPENGVGVLAQKNRY